MVKSNEITWDKFIEIIQDCHCVELNDNIVFFYINNGETYSEKYVEFFTGHETFVHKNEIQNGSELTEGELVVFETGEKKGKQYAKNAHRVSNDSSAAIIAFRLHFDFEGKEKWVYAESCGLILAFLGNGGRNAATIFSLRYSSSR